MEFSAHDVVAPRLHKPLGPGDIAPPFALRDQWGNLVSLNDYEGKKTVVLFFYPKDYAPNCTLEAIAFRESYAEFVAIGAEVIGVSQAPAESRSDLCTLVSLPFKLLTDPRHSVRDRFGAPGILGGRADRVTYVIGGDGVIRCIFRGAANARQHLREALRAAQLAG